MNKELLEELKKAGFTIQNKDYHIEPNKKKKWINLVVVKNPLIKLSSNYND